MGESEDSAPGTSGGRWNSLVRGMRVLQPLHCGLIREPVPWKGRKGCRDIR